MILVSGLTHLYSNPPHVFAAIWLTTHHYFLTTAMSSNTANAHWSPPLSLSDRTANIRVFSDSTIAEQHVATRRRLPIRRTRTNPARTASNPQVQGGALAQLPDSERNTNPGFFLAIQHFTNAIAFMGKMPVRKSFRQHDVRFFHRPIDVCLRHTSNM